MKKFSASIKKSLKTYNDKTRMSENNESGKSQ